jgi:hypothetical protein
LLIKRLSRKVEWQSLEQHMPKTPDDMSASAVEKRAKASAVSKAKIAAKAAEPPPPPKVRIAKGR